MAKQETIWASGRIITAVQWNTHACSRTRTSHQLPLRTLFISFWKLANKGKESNFYRAFLHRLYLKVTKEMIWEISLYKRIPTNELRKGRLGHHYLSPPNKMIAPGLGFLKYGPWTRSISITWELIKEVSHGSNPDLLDWIFRLGPPQQSVF